MRYLIYFIIIILTSCNGIMQDSGSPAMREDIAKAAVFFCKSQTKQMEVSQKMSKLKENGQTANEAVMADMEEINKYTEAYANALQEISVKYKGQEKAYANLIKEAQKRCK